jgi:hypothetical protein
VSYDFWLEIDTGDPEPHVIDSDLNYTSNVHPMWDLALKGQAVEGVAEMHGLIAGDCVGSLRGAVAEMDRHPLTFAAMNPENGWGDANGAREFLERMASACAAHPKATVAVSR